MATCKLFTMVAVDGFEPLAPEFFRLRDAYGDWLIGSRLARVVG